MKERTWTFSKYLFAFTAVCVLLAGCGNTQNDSGSGDELLVAVSFYPLAELASQIGGERVKVVNLTPPGAEPHDFEPSPRDVASIQKADIFIFNGAGFDPWAEKVSMDLNELQTAILDMSTTVALATVSKGGLVHAESESESDHADEQTSQYDPHFWLDPVEAQSMVKAITAALIKVNAERAQLYSANEAETIKKLVVLDESYSSMLSECTKDLIVASHASPGYLARRYGFGVLPISGIDPESEPSPRDLADITDVVNKEGIKHIFFESLVSPKFAETIAKETGASTLVFDPIEGVTPSQADKGDNYFTLMEQNLRGLSTALDCKNATGETPQ